jgi:hypothetical protein
MASQDIDSSQTIRAQATRPRLVDVANFLVATRDAGYRSTAYAVAEFVDYALHAGATITTLAPVWASLRTVAEPKPPAPPVTIAEALVRSKELQTE